MINKIHEFLNTKDNGTFFGAIFLFSLFSLILAFTIDFFHYHPCKLCMYQRIPFVLNIIFAVFGLVFNKKFRIFRKFIILSILSNILISGYHSGVENGVFEEIGICSSADHMKNASSKEEILNIVTQNQQISCKTPAIIILGASLAEWNFIWNLVLLLTSFFMSNRSKFKIKA